jgi:Flp pilus assembly protein protease CpaA
MNIMLLLLAVPICISDMHSFVIPNIYTKVLFSIALIHIGFFGVGSMQGVVVSTAALACLMFFGIGMGDIKLLGLILITHPYSPIAFISTILLFAVVHIVVLMGIVRRVPLKVPLAPSIFAGLLTYLATS